MRGLAFFFPDGFDCEGEKVLDLELRLVPEDDAKSGFEESLTDCLTHELL